MLDIYDKSNYRQYPDGLSELDCDANGCMISLSLLLHLWARLVGVEATSGYPDWSQVAIKSHPVQLSVIEKEKQFVTEDLFKVFARFEDNVKWEVDDKICPDMLEMNIGDKIGHWVRLSAYIG